MEMRGALIGCGFFAQNHINAWNDIDGVSIVALCDQDADRLTSTGRDFGVSRLYQNASDLFSDGGFDFVDIATTVASHRELVGLAAAHRIPAICQKPLATSFHQAKDIVRSAHAAGIPMMVHENFRWQTPIRNVREILSFGRIGTAFWGRFSFRTGYDIYRNQPYLAEGTRLIIEDLGVHILDVARFLLGDAVSISAQTNQVNPRIKGEDAATMLLKHESGATSVVDVSYATKRTPDPFPETLIEIDGSEGSIALLSDYRLQVSTSAGMEEIDVSPRLLPWASKPWHNVQESVLSIQRHWIECLRSGRQPESSGPDYLKTIALVEAAYESAQTGRTIEIRSMAVD